MYQSKTHVPKFTLLPTGSVKDNKTCTPYLKGDDNKQERNKL